MLRIRDLTKSYDKPVLRGFSYDFPDKGLVLIRGRSGTGKTTLLRLIAGLEKPDSGVIENSFPRVSMVFQEDRLLPFLTLRENVMLVKKERDEAAADALLARFGLSGDAKKRPAELSGGMRLRGAIVRSLYYGGSLYLWDEPTKELDPENRELVIFAAREIAKSSLVLAVTHDPGLAAERQIVLD